MILVDRQGLDGDGGDIDILADNDHTNAGAPGIAAAQGIARLGVVLSISLRKSAQHTIAGTVF